MRQARQFCRSLILVLSFCAIPLSAQADLVTGLQGYWQFNADGADTSGAGRGLDLVGSPGFDSGLLGDALNLTGNAGQFAQRPMNDTVFDVGGSDFTIQVWANFHNIGGEQTLFEKFTGGAGPGYTLTKLDNQTIQFFGSGLDTINTPGQTIDAGTWNQIVLRRSGSDFDIFFNNNSEVQSTQTGTVNPSSNPLQIGERQGAQQFPVNGLIDEVAFWNRGLLDSEIDQLYNNGNGLDMNAVPEPSSLGLLALAGMFIAQRRRRSQS